MQVMDGPKQRPKTSMANNTNLSRPPKQLGPGSAHRRNSEHEQVITEPFAVKSNFKSEYKGNKAPAAPIAEDKVRNTSSCHEFPATSQSPQGQN